MSCDQILYHIWPKSNNPRRNYWRFSTLSPALIRPTSRRDLDLWPFDREHLYTVVHRVSHDQSVPNLSEIEPFAAELLRVIGRKIWGRLPFWIWILTGSWFSHFSDLWVVHQLTKFQRNGRLSYWWFNHCSRRGCRGILYRTAYFSELGRLPSLNFGNRNVSHCRSRVPVRFHIVILDLSNAISRKRCKIGAKLVLIINRKSHIYELTIGTKLGDLEWPWTS